MINSLYGIVTFNQTHESNAGTVRVDRFEGMNGREA